MNSFFGEIKNLVVGLVEQERHRVSAELHGQVNQFLTTCQKGELDIQKIAELQNQLLGIHVDQNVSEKISSLEKKVRDFFEPQFADFLQKQNELRAHFEELLKVNRKFSEVQKFFCFAQKGNC